MSTSDWVFIVGLPCALGLLALSTAIAAQVRRSKLVRELRDVDGFLRAMREESETSHPLVAATREHLIASHAGDVDRFVLSKSLASVRREYAEDEVSHYWAFWVGGLLTGIALLATFALIAYVMTHDISGAINATAATDEETANGAMGALANAVRTLGGKFIISAAGIGGSVVALFFSNHARNAIFTCAEHPDRRLLAAFTTVSELELNARLDALRIAREARDIRAAQHEEVCRKLDGLNIGLAKLHSIDVSVRDIGNEVSANLKNVMKEAMADQFREILVEMMSQVNEIAERVQASLTQAFGVQFERLATAMQQSLEALQRSIEGQGQGQLEKILDKLQDTVSGGFQSEAKNMSAALESFAKVVPALEQQLRAMTTKIAEETRQHSEEGARLTRVLFDRLSSLMESLRAQQAANAEAIERMQAASAQGAEEIARRLEASGTNLVSNVLASSRVEVEAIAAQLRTAMETNATRFVDIEARAANASAAVAQASQMLDESARAVANVTQQIWTLLQHVKESGDGMQVAAKGFLDAGSALAASVEAMRHVIELNRVQTHEQQSLLVRQQQYTKEVEALWPKLFDTYLAKFRESSDDLARSWTDLHAKMAAVSKSVGSEFAEQTAALSEAVQKLVEAEVIGAKRAAR